MNKFGINLWNWYPTLSDACLGLPEKIREFGFTAIELPMTSPKISDLLFSEIQASGLSVSLCAALGPGRDLSNFDPEIRKNTMIYFEKCLETGARLGASVLAGPLYAGGGKRHTLSEDERKREWDLAVTGLFKLSERAEQYGIALALEPLNRYRTSVINTVEQMLRLLHDIGRENVGIHYDTYQACLEEADFLGSLEHALKSGKLMHVHACAQNRGGPGEGIIPWKEIFSLLYTYGYPGHITMETFAPGGLDASWVNVHGTPDEIAARGIAYLKQAAGA